MNIKEISGIAEIAQSVSPDERPDWLQRCRDTDAPLALYYRFLYLLAKALRPTWTLETGTRFGLGTAQLAMGWPESTVITLDIDLKVKKRLEAHPQIKLLKNVIQITGDSRQVWKEFPAACSSFDLVYLDSDHTYDVVMSEFKIYEPMVRPGGVMIFDDICLNPEMRRFWSEIQEPKVELNFLHRFCNAGFGAYLKPEVN